MGRCCLELRSRYKRGNQLSLPRGQHKQMEGANNELRSTTNVKVCNLSYGREQRWDRLFFCTVETRKSMTPTKTRRMVQNNRPSL